MFVEVENVRKFYGNQENRVEVLKGINMRISKGKICTILGASGSGKSTLLNLIGGLDVIEEGSVRIDGMDISKMNYKKLTEYRRNYLGYVFQFYNLIPNLNVKENIETCTYLSSDPMNTQELIEILGLQEHSHKFPRQLSGGQQQRCAIGRALAKKPKLLLCDEPTGALDSKTSKEILILLEKVNQMFGTTIIMVTHNTEITVMADMIIEVRDGQIVKAHDNENKKSAKDIEW